MIMAESSGIPTAHGSSSGSGYGLMGCERSVFSIRLKLLNLLMGQNKVLHLRILQCNQEVAEIQLLMV